MTKPIVLLSHQNTPGSSCCLIPWAFLLAISLAIGSCAPQAATSEVLHPTVTPTQEMLSTPTPLPERPVYQPGELVDYVAQSGDTLPALAAHFNTTEKEIRQANPLLPEEVTTLPPGLPLKIPIYYAPLWGSPFKIIPDSHFINSPAQIGFDTETFANQHPGWLRDYRQYIAGANRTGAEMVDLIATNFSLSPKLLLAILEHMLQALSDPVPPPQLDKYPLGFVDRDHRGLYLQLVWVANQLNNGYYGWRTGNLTLFDRSDGLLEQPDPWQNAASVGLQYTFARLLSAEDYIQAINPGGFDATYRTLFGDPWDEDTPHIPGNLQQPPFVLPFEPGKRWAFTGGPHTGWGEGEPLAALDFAPPAVVGGCNPSNEWATAVAPGRVVRSEPGTVVLDLDFDGDERTGWVVFYFHVATEGRAPLGARLDTGDFIGHPSCEGGRATGTHIHLARKYNGEWIPADGPLAFNLEGWIAQAGDSAYQGRLTRFGQTIEACLCSSRETQIQATDR